MSVKILSCAPALVNVRAAESEDRYTFDRVEGREVGASDDLGGRVQVIYFLNVHCPARTEQRMRKEILEKHFSIGR